MRTRKTMLSKRTGQSSEEQRGHDVGHPSSKWKPTELNENPESTRGDGDGLVLENTGDGAPSSRTRVD